MVPLPPLRDGARALPISSFRQSMPSFDTRCPGLHLQPGASVVLGCVGELPGSRCTDFNPRAPCGTRRERRQHRAPRPAISIHAPRVGRDRTMRKCGDTSRNFNPRAPCGARRSRSRSRLSLSKFQSTRPVWGATECMCTFRCVITNFNPRAPCGARRTRKLRDFRRKAFQSTRPVWGATTQLPRIFLAIVFQSTRPVWGATANLTILTRQICTKGTKEFLLGRKTHEERGKITQKLAYIHAFSAFFRCEGARTFCALVLRTQ